MRKDDAPTGVEALAAPAYNATLRAIASKAERMKETPIQKLAAALA